MKVAGRSAHPNLEAIMRLFREFWVRGLGKVETHGSVLPIWEAWDFGRCLTRGDGTVERNRVQDDGAYVRPAAVEHDGGLR